jgi:hypothetical protein
VAVRPVQRADTAVAHERDADDAARAGRGDARQPWTEAVRTNVAPPFIGDSDVEFAACSRQPSHNGGRRRGMITFGHTAHAAKSTFVSFVIS